MLKTFMLLTAAFFFLFHLDGGNRVGFNKAFLYFVFLVLPFVLAYDLVYFCTVKKPKLLLRGFALFREQFLTFHLTTSLLAMPPSIIGGGLCLIYVFFFPAPDVVGNSWVLFPLAFIVMLFYAFVNRIRKRRTREAEEEAKSNND